MLALNHPGILEDLRHVSGVIKPIDVPAEVNNLPDALDKPDWVVNPAWQDQPWDTAVGQSLVKDHRLFRDKGVGDITGIGGLVSQWNVDALVATLGSIGAAVATPITQLNVASVTEDALEQQFAEVAQAAKA